jgi:predicted nuclease with TOPRIM domain
VKNLEEKFSNNDILKELLTLLENSEQRGSIAALINHVTEVEKMAKQAESQIAAMQERLDGLEQYTPLKAQLEKAIETLKDKLQDILKVLNDIKQKIIDGAKKAIESAKDTGTIALVKVTDFMDLKGELEALRKDVFISVRECENTLTRIDRYAEEYHAAGKHIKNMARVAVGRTPNAQQKEVGKIAKAVGMPFRTHKAIVQGIGKRVNAMISGLENLEKAAERARKPSLLNRLEVKKVQVERLKRPVPERAMSGVEI